MFTRLSLVVLVLFLSGCQSRKYTSTQVNLQKFHNIHADYVWTVDVPVPAKAVEKKNYYQARTHSYQMGYTTPLSRDLLIHFYKEHMQQHDWQPVWELDGLEALLLFQKPHKQCAISIRSAASGKKQDVIILQKTVA